ncbi:MAG: secondary thiamine-phosphate synthase enzyme YjbQ [Pseudomonas marincola]
MKQKSGDISVVTQGRGLLDVSAQISRWVRDAGISEGILTIFIQHTSASLTIQENADPDVLLDLQDFFNAQVPEDRHRYRHSAEGLDDMPAHIKSSLTDVSLTIPIYQGVMRLGTWQGIYVFEHRSQSHQRSLALHVLGS